MTSSRKTKTQTARVALFSVFVILIILSIWLGLQLHRNSLRDKEIKNDYFTVNQIKYGMLSGNNWSRQVNRIVATQVDSFSFTTENKELLTAQMNDLLGKLFDEADRVLHKEREKLGEKLKYKLINAMVDVDDYRPEIPAFSKAIVDEISKSKHKKQIKEMLKKKIGDVLNAADQDTIGEKKRILQKYGQSNLLSFNVLIGGETERIRKKQQVLGYGLIGILVAVLLLWLLIFKMKRFYAPAFLFSVLISFAAMFTGVSLPMIEIDARIAELDLHIMSSHIVFYEQIIFYQAKSILDVITILVTDGKADTVFVGCLIFIFSVLFPVMKLICTTIYLFIRERSNRFIRYMAFNSGKWSMADVMVIAIFMAYVGFKGILDNQLGDIETHTETINVVTTNKTNLQTGFIVFVAFCLFNLIMAAILKKITKNTSD